MMKTKLGELLEFPCSFTYKIVGIAHPDLLNNVLNVIQQHAPGDYLPEVKPSSKGTYQAISITIYAKNIEQIETLYQELGNLNGVKAVL